MIFWILTPAPPRTWVPLFWGVGWWGGVKTSLRIVAAVCVFGPGSRRTFFLYMDPLTHGGVPGPNSKYSQSPPPHMAPCQ